MEKTVVFATCLRFPEMQADDIPAADALNAAGWRVVAAPWNAAFEPFRRADLVVVRSTWDYWDHLADFAAWLERLKELARVANDPALMLWNLEKRYLLELAAKGAPLPPTRLTGPTTDGVAAAVDALGAVEAVVKPLIGGGAIGLTRVRRGDRASLEQAASSLGGDGLVQPLIGEIAARGETSLLYFDGVFSHAVVKHPKAGDIRIQTQHGGATRAVTAPAWLIEEGRRLIGLLPADRPPTYARIDVVLREAPPPGAPSYWLMEVEVMEPSLYLDHAPAGAAAAFARALSTL